MNETLSFDLPAEIKALDDEPEGTIQGFASTFGGSPDSYGDVIKRGAFAASLKEHEAAGTLPLMLWHHRNDQPVGRWTSFEETRKGLRATGRLTLGATGGRDAYAFVKDGAVNGLSIGFRTRAAKPRDDGSRVLTDIELLEVSLVGMPANASARLTQVRALDLSGDDPRAAVPFGDLPLAPRARPWSAGSAARRVRAATNSADEPTARYRRGFLWYDQNEADQFGSYKLPIADVIDGRLTAVPRALFAAAAVMQGGRGGVDIPDGDRAGVRRTISRYYAKMRREFDDPNLVAPWDRRSDEPILDYRDALAGCTSTRQFEALLRDAGWSRAEARRICAGGFDQAFQWDADGRVNEVIETLRRSSDRAKSIAS